MATYSAPRAVPFSSACGMDPLLVAKYYHRAKVTNDISFAAGSFKLGSSVRAFLPATSLVALPARVCTRTTRARGCPPAAAQGRPVRVASESDSESEWTRPADSECGTRRKPAAAGPGWPSEGGC